MNDTDRVLNEWRPFKKQAIFLSIPWSIKEAFYGGGAGSAKTDTLLYYAIVHRLHENPAFKQVFMRRTFADLRKEVVPRSREIYRKFGATFNATNMIWTFPRPDQYGSGANPDGAQIHLAHCENEDDVHNYDSMEINLYTPDELTSYTEYIYLYIGFTRVRAKVGTGLPAIIRAGGMPGDIGHTWVKNRFVTPAPNGNKILVGRGGNKRIYIHATLHDNPHIDPSYKQSLEALPTAEKEAKLGNWDAYLGQVFEEFRDKLYPDEPSNALHVIEPFVIPDWWPRILVGDWGYAAMTYWAWAAISPNKRVYIYREQFWTKKTIEDWAPFVKEYIDVENPVLIKLCKSAGQQRGQNHTILFDVEQALGRTIELTNNTPGSRVDTKNLVHEYLRWKQKHIPTKELIKYSDEHAQWLLRNKTIEDYKKYLLACQPQEEEDNIPKLQIFNTCQVAINAIKACAYGRPGKDGKPPEDVAEFAGDDPYDVVRYTVDAADRYFTEAADKFEQVQKRSELMKDFELTGDWNFLYRNARKLEQLEIPKAIRRYRYH